ncbi:MAG: hypothetical protein U1E73_07070 [Planctomycetota bacterium]
MRSLLLLAAALCAGLVPAQTAVALPGDTGKVQVPDGWTVLGAEALARSSRPTDPTDEPAHSMLLAIVEVLQEHHRTADNVVLHQPGRSPGQLRTINVYSAPGAVTAAELQSDRAVEQMRKALAEGLAVAGTEVTFTGSAKWERFAVGGITLGFELAADDVHYIDRVHAVPAGDRIQYFETHYDKSDAGADAAIASVLATFDGAREQPRGYSSGVIIGAIAGALGGVLAGLARRHRKVAAAATPRDG